MKRNLSDFSQEKIETNKNFEDIKNRAEDIKNSTNDKTKQEVNDLYNKYKNYSQEELMNEFISTAKNKLQNGDLTQNKLQNTINSLSPFLNESQKEYLNNIIRKIND